MIDSILIGMTGLASQSKGLNVISNNVANLNTVGFKGASLRFEDLYYQEDARSEMHGNGVTTGESSLSMKQGETRQTGNDLDLMIDGAGLFVVNANGSLHFTRNGQFSLSSDGSIEEKSSGAKLSYLSDAGNLGTFSVRGRRTSAPVQTSAITFSGNLSLSGTQHTISNVTVYDGVGNAAQFSLKFENNSANAQGTWNVSVLNAAGTSVATGQIAFSGGRPVLGSDKISFSLPSAGGASVPVTLDFSTDATSTAGSADSTLIVSGQNGRPAGSLTKVTFDSEGRLAVSYSNGSTEKFEKLALAWFAGGESLKQEGGNLMAARDGIAPIYGFVSQGVNGKLSVGALEMSNVDISQQFSELIITQRAYQASSHIITTANEMLQQLFDMKGRR